MRSHSFALVTTLVAAFVFVFTVAAGCASPPSEGGARATVAESAPGTQPARAAVVSVLSTEPLVGVEGREVRMLMVEYPPGGSTPAHRHPGSVFVYVLEGEVLSGLDGGAPVRYRAGQSWSERPGQVHSTARNASDARPAKLLVFFVTEPGKPVVEMEH